MNDFENRTELDEALPENEYESEETAAETAGDFEQVAEETVKNAEENSGSAPENAEEADSLNQELENIKDMFQKELDSAAEAMLAGGDMQECDENGTDSDDDGEEEIPEEERCECCGENRRDTSVSEDYPYCAECRELMRHYPFGAKGILTLLAVLALLFASVFLMFPKTMDAVDLTLTGDRAASDGKLYTAFNSYYEAITAADSEYIPLKTVEKCAKTLALLNDYNDAASILNQYIPAGKINSKRYAYGKVYASKNATLTAIENVIYEPLTSGEATKKDIDGICKKLDELKNSEKNYDCFYIDYYKYVVMFNLGASAEETFEYLKKVDADYPNEWVHKYDLCNCAAAAGLIDEAQKYFDEIVAVNSQDGSAYASLAGAYRYGDKPDTEKMHELVKEGLEAQGDYNYSGDDLYRMDAVAYLIEGDNEKAYESAENMYSIVYQNGYNVKNLFPCLYTYALAAKLSGNDSAYDEVNALLKQNGYKMSSDVLAAVKGKKTVTEILTATEGDLK